MADEPTVAIVGASARAAAFSVLRAGGQVVAADLFADADLARSCRATRVADYPKGLVTWLKTTECDGWLYTGALENHPDLVDRMAAVRPLWGNAGEVIRAVRDPLVMQGVLRGARLAFPETIKATSNISLDGQWLAKTYRGSSGSGVCETNEDENNEDTTGVGYRQCHIEGTPGSAVFIGSANGSKLLGVTRQLVGEPWTGAAKFQYCGSVGPWNLTDDFEQQIGSLGEVLVDAFRLRGLFGVDFVFDGEQVWTVELNPRYTAAVEIVEHATGVVAMQQHLEACSGKAEAKPQLCHDQPVVGKAILFGERKATVSEKFTHWALQNGMLADVPTANTQLEPGQPVLTAFASAAKCDAVVAQLQRKLTEVRQRLFQGT